MATERSPAGRATRGSRRQLQNYVNLHADELSAAILARLPTPGATIRWVSPLVDDNYKEYRDAEFLTRLGLAGSVRDLAEFWPRGGPCWDALGIVESPDGEMDGAVILVEAKSHLAEVHGSGCLAESHRSIGLIRVALADTKEFFGADTAADWIGSLYQSANRLAHLRFFLDVLKRPAWLVNLYFVGDPIGPVTVTEWELDIARNKGLLGLSAPVRNCVDVFLPALEQESTLEAEVLVDPDRAPAKEAGLGSGLSFGAWRERWTALGIYAGAEVPDCDERRRNLIELWKLPIPGDWKRGIDTQLLGNRYRRGNAGSGARRGEHVIEHEILVDYFPQVTVLGGTLVDGVNAMPLSRDGGGGRSGNVEADLYLLVRHDDGYRLYVVEVKDEVDHAWYATVENLRQLRLAMESEEALKLFHRRNPELGLPESLPISGLVLAPASFYSHWGRKVRSAASARLLIDDMRAACDCHIHLAIWDRELKTII